MTKAALGLVLMKLSVACAVETDVGELSEDVTAAAPSYVDAGEATCNEGRRRNADWSSGIHDGCCTGFLTPYCMYGNISSSCPAGSEYIVVFGRDRCMTRVEPLRYAPAGAPTCTAGERWTDIVNGIGDRCCVGTAKSGWRCDLSPSCGDDQILFAARGDDTCIAAEETGELESLGPATCPDNRPHARVDLRHPTVDSCCTEASDCMPLVAAGACPDGARVVSVIGPDACMTHASGR